MGDEKKTDLEAVKAKAAEAGATVETGEDAKEREYRERLEAVDRGEAMLPGFVPTPPGAAPDFPVPAEEWPKLREGDVFVLRDSVYRVETTDQRTGAIAMSFLGLTRSWVKRMRKKYGKGAKR